MDDRMITGFKLELDGDPKAVKRVLDSIGKVLSEFYEESMREQMREFPNPPVWIRSLLPVHGRVEYHSRYYDDLRNRG